MSLSTALLRTAILAGALALAGCVAPAALPADSPSAPLPSADAALVYSQCHQMHMGFPARAEDFAEQVPPEFTILADSDGMTNLYVMVDACVDAADERVSTMWIELPVEPDAALSPPDGVHRYVFQGATDSPALHAALAARGFGLAIEEGSASIGHPVGAGLASTEAVFASARGEYRLTTARTISSGTFGEEEFQRWAADAEGVIHRLVAHATESSNLGFGGVSFVYSGGDAAPPAAQGIAHEVVGAGVTLRFPEVA